ncbi:MAG: N-acetylmuramic acid 6-phosphate etherase, partial [Selenomonadaceae bacterium]|nr:N-acetylmuramic acid 6-phosphate etherase [Selenomonadaceae bacterium]
EERARRIVMEAAGCTREESITALKEAGGSAKLAILLQCTGLDAEAGQRLLEETKGRLALALRKKMQ